MGVNYVGSRIGHGYKTLLPRRTSFTLTRRGLGSEVERAHINSTEGNVPGGLFHAQTSKLRSSTAKSFPQSSHVNLDRSRWIWENYNMERSKNIRRPGKQCQRFKCHCRTKEKREYYSINHVGGVVLEA